MDKKPKNRTFVPLATKLEALQILKENNLNYTLTQEQTGHNKQNLAGWWKLYKDKLITEKAEDVVIAEMVTNISELHQDYKIKIIPKYWETHELILDKIKDLIDKTNDITKLASTMQIVNSILMGWEGKEVLNGNVTNVSFYQQINKMADDKKNILKRYQSDK